MIYGKDLYYKNYIFLLQEFDKLLKHYKLEFRMFEGIMINILI